MNKLYTDFSNELKECHKCNRSFPKTGEFFRRSDGYLCSPCYECRLDRKRVSDSLYYQKNRDIIEEKKKSYRNSNKEAEAAWMKNNYGTPWGRYRHYRNSAKARNIGFELTLEEFKELWQKPCYFCADDILKIGLDRMDSSVGYIKSNVVPCCTKCNFAKHLMSVDEFIEHCEKVVVNFKQVKRLVSV